MCVSQCMFLLFSVDVCLIVYVLVCVCVCFSVCIQPYRRADAVRRSVRRRFDDQNLRSVNGAEMTM